MATTDPTPADVLARLLASDPARPRVTVYDDTDGPTRGERVELSARVLANWVAKAANLLQDELDAGPGSTVRLSLPPHWRTLYWAWAAWSVGACVELGGPPAQAAEVLVTDEPTGADGSDRLVVVTLAALARQAASPVPVGSVDEARELARHGDVFVPMEEPDPTAPGLRTAAGTTSLAALVPAPSAAGRVHTATDDTEHLLRLALATWAGDGSLVLSRGTPGADVLASRLASEGVTGSA
ncbi:TIGR03089 family protein [Phycicoccus endophyticus]|uniref:TIGR03089 family protein n=1 Tax=Phycicoccus endophyticus TaxID=1690220 RepID=A0A7G9R333_9MICO|nr:TIGR03089 family protein [Phycicoccus endophyticus]NHI20301.1 TIGR03089 family protein [Phycicoccus endophyticus]QNN50008.1 TIGR03089 family protein [Phycicoccus endophyticus]